MRVHTDFKQDKHSHHQVVLMRFRFDKLQRLETETELSELPTWPRRYYKY